MSADYLCKLTAKINELQSTVTRMQENAGLYSDDSDQETLTGRIKYLEENVISSDPKETNISRMKVEYDLEIEDGKFHTVYWPIGGCVNREVMVQSPDDSEIWEAVGGVTFEEDEGDLHTLDYDGWKLTVSYIYAVKIVIEEYDFVDVDKEFVRDLADMAGSVYRVKFIITPTDGGDDDEDPDLVTLRWENSDDETDYTEEDIETEHVRTVDEEDFNYLLKVTGSCHVLIEIRNRLG